MGKARSTTKRLALLVASGGACAAPQSNVAGMAGSYRHLTEWEHGAIRAWTTARIRALLGDLPTWDAIARWNKLNPPRDRADRMALRYVERGLSKH